MGPTVGLANGDGVGTDVGDATVVAAVETLGKSGVAVAEVPQARMNSRNDAANTTGPFLTTLPFQVRKILDLAGAYFLESEESARQL